jgi:hypothetical protein
VVQYNTFGIRGIPIERCASELGELLEVEIAERESDYLGRYFLGRSRDFAVQIVEQPDPEGEPLESKHFDYGVIVYLKGNSRFESIEGRDIGGSPVTRLDA